MKKEGPYTILYTLEFIDMGVRNMALLIVLFHGITHILHQYTHGVDEPVKTDVVRSR